MVHVLSQNLYKIKKIEVLSDDKVKGLMEYF